MYNLIKTSHCISHECCILINKFKALDCKKTSYELFERSNNILSSERRRYTLGGHARYKQSSVRAARGGGVGQDRVAGTVCSQWELCARAIVMKPEGIFCQCELRTDNIFFFAMSAVLLCFYSYGFPVLALEKIWQRYFSVIFLSTSGR